MAVRRAYRHVLEKKVTDNAETLELAELEVARLVEVCHHSGLTYWEILGIFLDYCQKLLIQADAEYYMKQRL